MVLQVLLEIEIRQFNSRFHLQQLLKTVSGVKIRLSFGLFRLLSLQYFVINLVTSTRATSSSFFNPINLRSSSETFPGLENPFNGLVPSAFNFVCLRFIRLSTTRLSLATRFSNAVTIVDNSRSG